MGSGARSIVAAAGLLCLSATAFADTTVTITTSSSDCKVAAPDEMISNSPSVAAGEVAIKNGNFALAKANFKPLAEMGDPDGQRAYGDLLLTKCTGLTDSKAGADWLQKAADGGNIPAAAELGNAYMNADGVAQDDNKAFALITKAAAAGHGGWFSNSLIYKQTEFLQLSARGTSSSYSVK